MSHTNIQERSEIDVMGFLLEKQSNNGACESHLLENVKFYLFRFTFNSYFYQYKSYVSEKKKLKVLLRQTKVYRS